MNHVKAVRGIAVLALALGVQSCGKEAPPPATKVEKPTATKAETPQLAAAGSTGAQATGEGTYKKVCAACHDQGVAGAPKLGDKAAWEPRVKQGIDALYTVGLQGKPGTGMLAKGGNPSLSDVDVKAAVDYMVSKVK